MINEDNEDLLIDDEEEEEEETNIFDEIIDLVDELNVISEEEEIKHILSLFPDTNEENLLTFRKLVFDRIMEETETSLKDLRIWYNEKHDNEIDLGYSVKINDNITVYLNDDGCYSERWLKNRKITDYIYRWDSFIIHSKYKMEESPWRYNFELNGIFYEDSSKKELKDTLFIECFQGNRGKSFITYILEKYLVDVEDISKTILGQCGFVGKDLNTETETWGWILPPLHKILYTEGIMNKIYKNIKKNMSQHIIIHKNAKKYFTDIYELANITNKDIIFAWGFAAPYMHAMKRLCSMMPILSIDGDGGIGKSAIENTICSVFYGHLFLNLEGNVSFSRCLGALGGSTFPITIDDCEKLGKWFVDMAKQHTTQEYPFMRKVGQKLEVDCVLTAPMAINHNKHPKVFDDIHAKERIIYLLVEKTEEIEDWEIKINKIPKGYIGKYIIEKTKNWDLNKIEEIFLSRDDHKGDIKRDRDIARILEVGCYIAKEFFDMELDVSKIKEILNETKSVGLDKLYDHTAHLIKRGSKRNDFGHFHPTDWVKNETEEIYHKHVWGCLIDTNKTESIIKKSKETVDVSTFYKKDLYKYLQFKWKDIEYKVFNHKGVSSRLIFIPNKHIIGKNISIYEYENLTNNEKEKLKPVEIAETDEELIEEYEKLVL